MSDLMRRIRQEQAALSREFSRKLLQEFKPYIHNGKLSALEGYVKNPSEDVVDDFDRGSTMGLVESDLGSAIVSSVIGYTDFALSQIVRSVDYSVPHLNKIPWAALEQKYDAPSETLKRTVGFMHSKESLPLLGRITLGAFHPDKEELQQWKELYDWN